jgi:hypothetical protein
LHQPINKAVATPSTLHIECRNGVACDSREINRWLALGVRDDPNLEAIPPKVAGIIFSITKQLLKIA